MIQKTVQRLKRGGFVPLIVVGVLVALWAASSVGAAPLPKPLAAGPPPTVINYQGIVQVGGAPFDGIGYFKFAIVDSSTGNGTGNSWANDGAASGEPSESRTWRLTVYSPPASSGVR